MGDIDAEVLVVGAGPVGLTLAVELALRGTRVRIIDSLAEPTDESRAIVVHARSLDHFEALGVYASLRSRGIASTGVEFHAGGSRLAHVPLDAIEAVHRFSLAIPQTETEAVLTERLMSLGARIERSRTLVEYIEENDEVIAEIANADDPRGPRERAHVRYLVGADGARSTVRHVMGERLEGSFKGEDFLLGDVDAEYPYDRGSFHIFFSSGVGTGLLFPLPNERVRVFAQLPDGTDPNRPATRAWLEEAMAERKIDLHVRHAHWLARFQVKHGQAPRYRSKGSGRVFITGDAAHIHSPAGALGMNTGIQDAVNLGWKLALALRVNGTNGANGANGASALLDSYQTERYPVAADVIRFSTALTTIGTLKRSFSQDIRNTAMRFGMKLHVVEDRIARTVEQQTVSYPKSPIVSGRSGALHAGDFLYVPGVSIAAALAGASGTGHLAIPVGRAAASHALPPDLAVLRDEAVSAALAAKTAFVEEGVVLVRPDGYIGLVADADAIRRGAVAAYFEKLTR